MNAVAKKEVKPTVRSFREREHRVGKLPVSEMITMRMEELKMKNTELAKALGYPMPNVIAMIKHGSMRLPESLALTTADILKFDRVSFLGKVIAENNPRLWDSIVEVLGNRMITDNEMELVKLFRDRLQGFDDVRLDQEQEFLKAIKAPIDNIVKLRTAEKNGTLERLQREKTKKTA